MFARKTLPPRQAIVHQPLKRPVHAPNCSGMGEAQPKEPRAVNRHLLNMARDKPCLIRSPRCVGGTDSTVACHGAGIAKGKGLGYKVGDHLSAWGCWACNNYTDAYTGATRAQKEAAFMLGHLRQVLEWRQIGSDAGAPAKDRAAAQWALDRLGATLVAIKTGAT